MNGHRRILGGPFFIGLAGLAWIALGLWLIFSGDIAWGFGELGDFFGGGLGGLAFFLLIYTTWMQRKDLERQQELQDIDSMTQRFSVLRADLENASAQVASKAKACTEEFDSCSCSVCKVFDEHLRRFKKGERNIFMRHVSCESDTYSLSELSSAPGEVAKRRYIELFDSVIRSHDGSSSRKQSFISTLEQSDAGRLFRRISA